ncbi:MAG: Holliday junction branch migration protein RuvA, partial [Solirubrobacterales bacterium]
MLRLHPAGGEDVGLRDRRCRQGSGQAHGRRPLGAAGGAAVRACGGRARCGDLPRGAVAADDQDLAWRRSHRRQRGGGAVIASVSGELTVRRPDQVVVDAGGVGYRLAVSSETLRAIPAVGNTVGLHAHLIARDDSMALYGFATEEERDLFLMLISVSGVGPKVGLAALSGGAVRELLKAIA